MSDDVLSLIDYLILMISNHFDDDYCCWCCSICMEIELAPNEFDVVASEQVEAAVLADEVVVEVQNLVAASNVHSAW